MVIWQRNPNIVWRIGADRVLVRVIGGTAHDLVGAAALVWAALDEPADAAALRSRLADADVPGFEQEEISEDKDPVSAALDLMRADDLIRPVAT